MSIISRALMVILPDRDPVAEVNKNNLSYVQLW